jgi:aspartate kinase
MKVFKFGGASVRDAEGIRNLGKIIGKESDNIVIVVSAFGKTTNALEKVLKAWLSGNGSYEVLLNDIHNNHRSVIESLLGNDHDTVGKIDNSFALLRNFLATSKRREYDFSYDQIVSYGEIWSTMIVAQYLKSAGFDAEWTDIREILVTDERFRDANVLWKESAMNIQKLFSFTTKRIYITQGFIGGTISGDSTTLGREGSDYTAAILANMLDATEVVVWKDVPGILNADPDWLEAAGKLDEISYREAVEMSFSGAKIIHPKTIKPLHNKNIPLYVKSFLFPEEPGTVIKADVTVKRIIPVFIRKEDQILISITPRDFSFVMGENLSRIFHLFTKRGIKVNLVEASAVNIDVCVDDERGKIETLISDLTDDFSAVYNDHIELLTIRHFTSEAVDLISKGREILLEQKTRNTVRFVVRSVLVSTDI